MKTIHSWFGIFNCKISIHVGLCPKLIILQSEQKHQLSMVRNRNLVAAREKLNLVRTLLSVCHEPSVLAADSPMYADLAGSTEAETNLVYWEETE